MSNLPFPFLPAGLAFDRIARSYDDTFTFSPVGRAQRNVVWQKAMRTFKHGSHILELNCGTGEDAFFLTANGMRVTACDASQAMIAQAKSRLQRTEPTPDVQFLVLPSEHIGNLPDDLNFDGAFSNFSGLNCTRDLSTVMSPLIQRLRPGAPLLLCLSARYCLWEIFHHLLHGRVRKAFRRCGGVTEAKVDGLSFPVYYPTVSQLRRVFGPALRIVSITGVGITVPPSYLNDWITRYPQLLALLTRIDETIQQWPLLRVLGDHMLLHIEQVHS